LRAKRDVLFWLERFAYTLDEDHAPDEPAIKRFPSRKDRPDLYELAYLWWTTQKLGADKSRQMMVTWVLVLCNLWLASLHEGKLVFFQSKKEKDAIHLLDRAQIAFDRLPAFLRPEYQRKEAEMIFPRLNSKIWAIPQGGDHIRSYTASSILSDEAAKQPEFAEAYAASIPSIGKQGKFSFVSTPRGLNYFYVLMKDK